MSHLEGGQSGPVLSKKKKKSGLSRNPAPASTMRRRLTQVLQEKEKATWPTPTRCKSKSDWWNECRLPDAGHEPNEGKSDGTLKSEEKRQRSNVPPASLRRIQNRLEPTLFAGAWGKS